MALRELMFEIGFKGNASDIVKMDSAVDGLKGKFRGLESQINKSTEASQNFAGKMGNGIKAVGKFAVAGAAALAGVGVATTLMASDVEETQGKFKVVFNGMQTEMEKWSETQSRAMGRSKFEFQEYLANAQNMFVGMGMTREAGADLSKQMVTLGVDLASFNNLSDTDAIDKLNKALMGEHDSAKSLGAVLNDNTLALEMERMGLKGKFQELSEGMKMQVRYNSILSQSKDAVGDAERTNGSFANQMRAMKAGFKDMGAEIGMKFLPIATNMINKINENMPQIQATMEKVVAGIGVAIEASRPYFEKAIDIIGGTIETIGKFAKWASKNMDVLTPILISVGVAILAAVVPAFIAWAAATWALISPILAIMAPIIAVGAVVAAAVFIWKNWGDNIKAVLASVWEKIKGVFAWIGSLFTRAVEFVISIGTKIKEALFAVVMNLIEIIKKFHPLAIIIRAMSAVTEYLFGFSLVDIGKNIIQGLIDGMTGMLNKVKETVSNIGNFITDKFKSLFGIHSPSRVFMEIGDYNMQGLDKGMIDGSVDVNKTVESVAGATISGASAPQQTTNSTFNPTINITVNGGTREAVNEMKLQFEELMRQYNKRMSLGVV